MYVRRKTTPKRPGIRMQIVEGVRDARGKVKQRVVRHIGVAHNEFEEEDLIELGEQLIIKIKKRRELSSGQERLFSDEFIQHKKGVRSRKKLLKDIIPVDQVSIYDVEEVKRVVEGVHDVGGSVFDSLGFNKLLKNNKHVELLKDIVLSRMVKPDSKRGLNKLLKDQFDKEHQLDSIYRMMDKVWEKIKTIKKLCFEGTRSLIPNQEVSLVFFDVTTLYLESEEVDDIRAFGYSKDCRFNTTQVVLALATNVDGLPIGYELFSGNTAEVKTLLLAIRSWESYLKIKNVCFVADRAMFTRENLELLDKSGYRYIVAAKLRKLNRETKDEILSGGFYRPTAVDNKFIWAKEIDYEGKRLIVNYSSSRAKKDAKDREVVIDKIKKVVGTNGGGTNRLISNTGIKRYTTTTKSITTLDQDKIEQDALWDGLHGIITNDKRISINNAISKYSRLWVIEEAFRINKNNLQMRPIFHWTKKRIEAHIAICYMSFTILKHIEYKVASTKKISVKDIMSLLLNVQASIHQHKSTKDLYRLPGVMKNDARVIYSTFNIKRQEDAHVYMK